MNRNNFEEGIKKLSTICKSTFSIISTKNRVFGNTYTYEELEDIILKIKSVFPDDDVLIHQGKKIGMSFYIFTFKLTNSITYCHS